MRILLIEDDPLILDSLAELLLEHGYDVSTADGGESGLVKFCQAIIDGAPFGAVVSDPGMSHLDGRELISRIRQIDPGTLTVLLTQPVRVEEVRLALAAALSRRPG